MMKAKRARPRSKHYNGMMKVVIVGEGFPNGVPCNQCTKPARPDDVVAVRRVVRSMPVLLHKECLQDLLDVMPFDSGRIRGSIRAGFRKTLAELDKDEEEEEDALHPEVIDTDSH